MAFDLDTWYSKVNTEDCVFSFKGNVTAEIITNILTDIEDRLKEKQEDSKVRKRMYNILVEALQNLFHHVDPPPADLQDELGEKFASILIKEAGAGSYKIICGNFVLSRKVGVLKERIDQINSLNMEERKSLYKLILNNQEYSEKGGGGLGLIDIARRTGSDLVCQFFPVNDMSAFYVLQIMV